MSPYEEDPATTAQPSGLVSASEIASWAWCPESWRLERGLGKEAGNQVALRKGERFHEASAAIEQRSRATLTLGSWFLVLAAIVAIAFFLFGMRP